MEDYLIRTRLTTLVRFILPVCLVFVFLTIFINTVLVEQAPTIYQREFSDGNWDDHLNATVSGNVYRLFFPIKVRINPLIDKFDGNWAIGPYWQHIPPLFAYTSLPFFLLDGQVSIEMYRLSFAIIAALTGIMFIVAASLFTRSLLVTLAATIASVIWVISPFTSGLLNGGTRDGIFGISDITLAFTVVLAFATICWYLNNPKSKRTKAPIHKIAFITFMVTLPILAKSTLGAIPVVTFFVMLLIDQRKINLKVIISVLTTMLTVMLFYGSLFVSSPETFIVEIMTPFKHFGNYESWGKPWHFFITDYLPNYYFKSYWYLFTTIFLLGLYNLAATKHNRRVEIILKISVGWFIWNLVAVSLVTSKAPNFMYQVYLFAIFFSTYTLVWLFHRIFPVFSIIPSKINKKLPAVLCFFLLVGLLLTTSASTVLAANNAITELKKHKNNNNYFYTTTGEKFYELAEYARDNGAGLKDIFIIKPLYGDNWMTYYFLFISGSEARLEQDLFSSGQTFEQLKRKFDRLYVVLPADRNITSMPKVFTVIKATTTFQLVSFDIANMDNEVNVNSIISSF